jgi:hypothetical protein
MTALEILVQQLDEKIGQLKDAVTTGNFEIFEEYKRTCGYYYN